MRLCRLSLHHEGVLGIGHLVVSLFPAPMYNFLQSASYAVDDISWGTGEMISDLDWSLRSRYFLNVANERTCFSSCGFPCTQINEPFNIFEIFTVQLDLFLQLDITLRAFGFLFAYPEASAIWYWHRVVELQDSHVCCLSILLPLLLNQYTEHNSVHIWARGPAKPQCRLFSIYAEM